MTEAEWLSAANATDLWAFVRHELRFNRHVEKNPTGKEDAYNQRLLYLLGVAVCRRLEPLFPDPCCQSMIQVAEAYAEGTATLDELADAHDAIDDRTDDEATIRAAVNAVFWLSPDDYKVIRTLDFATDAAGYLYAIGAGVLPVGATQSEGKAIWEHPAFLAGKEAEERAVCELIRDVMGDPFRPLPPLPPAVLAWNDSTGRRIAEAIYEERRMPEGTLDTNRLAILADALEEAGCANKDILYHLREPGPHIRGCWAVDLILAKE